MSGFTALNVEPEDDLEEEIDDTREIQLEEAFKLYQNALKLHSQGPAYFDKAADAYQELLQSEVFKYPEFESEFAHNELPDDGLAGTAHADSAALSLVPGNATESSASSVPQLLYLAFKNRGQFNLDVARHRLQALYPSRAELCRYYTQFCNDSIRDFAKALERDDTDLDLWKKAARVADVLSSQRIARFCLESVVAGDDQDSGQAIDLSGLDEAFAAGELEEVLNLIQDDLSRSRSSGFRPKPELLAKLKKTVDPYPFLPARPTTFEYVDDTQRPNHFTVPRTELTPTAADFLSLGQSLHETICGVQDASTALTTATTVTVDLSPLLPPEETGLADTSPNAPAKADEPASSVDASTDKQPPLAVTDAPPLPSPTEIDAPGDTTATAGGGPQEPNDEKNEKNEKNEEAVDSDTIEVRNPGAVLEEAPPTTRKRSATLAGSDEHEGRTKSKRLRARESLADTAAHDEDLAHEDPQHFVEQLAVYERADQEVWEVLHYFLAKLDIPAYTSAEDAKQAFWDDADNDGGPVASALPPGDLLLLRDLRHALIDWSDDKGHAIVNGHGNQDFVEKSTGMTLFLQHSKPARAKQTEPSPGLNTPALVALAAEINSQPTNLYDAAKFWLASLLTRTGTDDASATSSYLSELWSPELKHTVTEMAVTIDAFLYEMLRQELAGLVERFERNRSQQPRDPHDPRVAHLFEFVQSLFEVFLDVHAAITNPTSEVDNATRVTHGDRVKRWASLADDCKDLYIDHADQPEPDDPLILRFVWATVTFATMPEDVDKDHVIMCLQDMSRLLEGTGAESIHLLNNTAMPVISAAAVDQEISRLKSLDFFISVFDSDNGDPVTVIEKLEPILELIAQSTGTGSAEPDHAGTGTATTTGDVAPHVVQLINFLKSGDAALRLFLWRRLQNAYTAISYPPKVVSCLLRAIETIYGELHTPRHGEEDAAARQVSMLKWLRDIDELMIKVIGKILVDPKPFECLDEAHVRSSLTAVNGIARLLHGFALYEDSVRVGQTAALQLKGASSSKLFDKAKDRFKEMLVRTWVLQYTLLKEATVQDAAAFPAPQIANWLAEYLVFVHQKFGLRHYCKHANKAFVKLVRSELASLAPSQDYAVEEAQLLYDMYQLRFINGMGDENHGCPVDVVDRKTAWALIPTVMKYANRSNIKDLLKNELKATIDRCQHAVGVVKSSPSVLFNKRLISAYLKSPLIPADFYQCLRGIGDLPTRPVQSDALAAVNCGWYYLLGHLNLVKYKSVKRVNPTPTDELDHAATAFRQDLDHGIEKWETWYRLAQVYEAKIEDDLIWNSTKLNDSRADIALLERQTIHSYIMATAVAMRLDDCDAATADKIQDMLADFASRLYASSRPPLNMEAFRTDKHQRHMSSVIDQTMSKQPFHEPFGELALWNFAAHLLGKKISVKPKPWVTHYTRVKCLWKMFGHEQNRGRVSPEDVLEAVTEAIDALPKNQKSNEPILEPHFKLVSVVHKMVKRGHFTCAEAYEYMQASRYAMGIALSEEDDEPDWQQYVLDVLKKLGQADKSNWHHRITDRAAHVIYDDSPDIKGALGAKHQFTQQIFTKTMTLQVWKPEHERAGRHYVYTGRYVSFFAHLLEQTQDRTNLDQLVRRIRRKTTDFLNHTAVWEEVVKTYVRLLRRIGKVPDGFERQVFDGMNHEEYTKRAEALEVWAHNPATNSVFLDVMRDAIELKRLNNSLMKGPLIDDLIGDSYASLYRQFLEQLPPEDQPKPQPPPLPQGTFINMTTNPSGSGQGDGGSSHANHVLGAQQDGTADGSLAVTISAPVGLGLQTGTGPFVGINGPAEVTRVPGKPGRTKTVTRREIQRKAEAAIVKPPPIKTPILSKKITVEIPARAIESGSPGGKIREEVREGDMGDSRRHSRRSSVADSADGEADGEDNSSSELSNLEDMDEEKKQLVLELENTKDDDGEGDGQDVDDNDADDEDGDDTNDVADDGSVADGAKSDGGDEEMVDAEDQIEIPDSQDYVEHADSPGHGEEEEFHEAPEEAPPVKTQDA